MRNLGFSFSRKERKDRKGDVGATDRRGVWGVILAATTFVKATVVKKNAKSTKEMLKLPLIDEKFGL